MYFPPLTPPALVQEKQGVWAPADHQRIIAKLTTHLGKLYYIDKVISLKSLPETMLDDARASLVPDLSLVDNTTDQTPIIIEVCKSKGQKGYVQKVVRLIDEDLYGILEGFIDNYKTDTWLRYKKGDGGMTTDSFFRHLTSRFE